MFCPKCDVMMRQVGFEQPSGLQGFVEMQCPACRHKLPLVD